MQQRDKKEPEKFKGVGTVASALGQSEVDSAIGGAAGLVLGAGAGALLHNTEKHALTTNFFRELGEQAATLRLRPDQRLSIELPEKIKELGVLKAAWHALPRGSKALVGAVGLALSAAFVGSITGLFNGASKAKAAREQFDTIAQKNEHLETRVEELGEQLAESRSFVRKLEAERSASKHHGMSHV